MIKCQFRVHFDDADPAKILFFGRYFNFAHKSVEEFVEQSGIGWKQWFAHAEWGVPLRHAECEYISPLFAGDVFTTHVQVSQIGTSSVGFFTDFYHEQRHCARVKTTHVFFDFKQKKKCEIPDDIRSILKEHLMELAN